jgi:O-antigen ligase
MQEAGGQATESTDRLTKLFRGERTGSDEARDLLTRKAWRVALEHPLVGIGAGRFKGYYHPVVEEASKPSVRTTAIYAQGHNTYAETMASIGFPGALATFGMLLSTLIKGLSQTRLRDVRIATCTLCGSLFMIYFFSALGSLLFLSLALVLGTAEEAEFTEEHQTTQDASTIPIQRRT